MSSSRQHFGQYSQHHLALDIFNAFPMPSYAKIETAQSITAQRVSSTLEHNACGLVEVHHLVDDRLEKVLVTLVINAIP
jgi:hypothetical protein